MDHTCTVLSQACHTRVTVNLFLIFLGMELGKLSLLKATHRFRKVGQFWLRYCSYLDGSNNKLNQVICESGTLEVVAVFNTNYCQA